MWFKVLFVHLGRESAIQPTTNALNHRFCDMNHLIFPFDDIHHDRRLTFFLAAEEWVARALPDDDYIFTWVVSPTVICGRHQDIALEVDVDYCRTHDIDIVRRRSGGGCVYADRHNIMISYVCSMGKRSVADVFSTYSRLVADRLCAMGFDANASGRNDVVIGGRKISGGAFYRIGDKAIAHSTMLFDTDFENMMQAITPARAKLASKGVTSVSSHIVTAHELKPDMNFDFFRRNLVAGLETSRTMVTPENIAEIENIERCYRDPAWMRITSFKPHHSHHRPTAYRLDGVGTLSADVSIDAAGYIAELKLSGDFMSDISIDEITTPLIGLRANVDELAVAVNGERLSAILPGVTPGTLAELIVSAGKHTEQTIHAK